MAGYFLNPHLHVFKGISCSETENKSCFSNKKYYRERNAGISDNQGYLPELKILITD
jgi:hypothetical protein